MANTRQEKVKFRDEEQKIALLQFVKPRARYLFGDYVGLDGRGRRVKEWQNILAFAKE